jgi:hypothetical protein
MSEIDTEIETGRSEGGYDEGNAYERQIKEIIKKNRREGRIKERRKLML